MYRYMYLSYLCPAPGGQQYRYMYLSYLCPTPVLVFA